MKNKKITNVSANRFTQLTLKLQKVGFLSEAEGVELEILTAQHVGAPDFKLEDIFVDEEILSGHLRIDPQDLSE